MNHTAGNIRSDDLNRNMIESSKKPPQLMRVLTSHNVCYARFMDKGFCPVNMIVFCYGPDTKITFLSETMNFLNQK